MGYNDEYAGSVVIDIETVACPDVDAVLDPIRAPANYKDPFKILTYQQDKLAERIATASLEPDLCEVVALGVQLPHGHVAVVTRVDGDEIFLLEWFWSMVAQHRLIGFNILSFDLPVLIRRSQLLQVKHPTVNLDRYRTPHLDLLDRLSFNGKIPFRSLNFYCRRFGIPSDDPVSGADIPVLVAGNDWTLIHDHCESDIRKTGLLATRLGWFTNTGQADVA